jgi:hypothetical protein
VPVYADDEPVRNARQRYFEANGLGEGGYAERWVKFKAGPFPVAFPNTKGRVRAVRMHDLHHLLTGYDTNLLGEGEIGAWEVASGCHHHRAAWVLNLLAYWGGLLAGPASVWRAFVRGRRSGNLYAGEWDEALLDRTVGELRNEVGVAPAGAAAEPGDGAAFAVWTALAVLAGVGPTALIVGVVWACLSA